MCGSSCQGSQVQSLSLVIIQIDKSRFALQCKLALSLLFGRVVEVVLCVCYPPFSLYLKTFLRGQSGF
jgi:hypothetical protein